MKKLIPFIVVIVVLVTVGLVAAQGGLPGSGWKSGQQIQNVGAANAKVVFTAYDLSGTGFDCGEKTIGAGASETYLTDVDCPVPAGFVGSAVVSADQPIAAIECQQSWHGRGRRPVSGHRWRGCGDDHFLPAG
jgi:hypothetical protein